MSRSLIIVLVAFLVWLAITVFAMFCLQGWVALSAFILGTIMVSLAGLGCLDQKRPTRNEDSPFPPHVTAEAAAPAPQSPPQQASSAKTFTAQKLFIRASDVERISLRQGQGSLIELSVADDNPEQVWIEVGGDLLYIEADETNCALLDLVVPVGVPIGITANGETAIDSASLDNELTLTLSGGAKASLGDAKHVNATLDSAEVTAATVSGDLYVNLDDEATLTVYGGAIGLLRGRVDNDSHLEIGAEVKVMKLVLAGEGCFAADTVEDVTIETESSSEGTIKWVAKHLKATLTDSTLKVSDGKVDFLDVTAEGDSFFIFGGIARHAEIDAAGDTEVRVGICLGSYRIRECDDSNVEIGEILPINRT